MKITICVIVACALCISTVLSNAVKREHNKLLTPAGSLPSHGAQGHAHAHDLLLPTDPLAPLDPLDPLVDPLGPLPGDLPFAPEDSVCTNYVPFRDNWVCPSSQLKYDMKKIQSEVCSGLRGSYPINYEPDIGNCYKENMAKPEPIRAAPESPNRTIVYSQLCEPVQVPIYHLNVYDELTGRTQQCSIVNCDNLRQSINYTKCVNPITKDNDMCQLDYTTRTEYRCVQSGFIDVKVLVHCPNLASSHPHDGVFKTVEHKIPTACSCKKCFHCQDNLAQSLSELDALAQMGFETFN